MIRVETKHLSKHYASVRALDDVSLSIRAGEVFCLLGPNGAGKTTLLNVLLGFVPATSGEALVNGVDVSQDVGRARRSIAYIPELVTLYPALTAIENLRFFAELAGCRHTRGELEGFLSDAGLAASDLGRRVETYSKGMRQKVGIAIALAKRADVLLLDEPTSGLDPSSANEFTALIARLAAHGCAALMTTHDLFLAKTSASRVAIMRGGQLVATFAGGTLDSHELERAYLAHV